MNTHTISLEYIYQQESPHSFSYFRFPKTLFSHQATKALSNDGKLLYMLLLDRVSLSLKHHWVDNQGRVFIYYTIQEACDMLGKSYATVIRLMAELDQQKGLGLIHRKKQGLGKPDIIFVKTLAQKSQEQGNPTEEGAGEVINPVEETNSNSTKSTKSLEGSSCNNRTSTKSTKNFGISVALTLTTPEVAELNTTKTNQTKTDVINSFLPSSLPKQGDKTHPKNFEKKGSTERRDQKTPLSVFPLKTQEREETKKGEGSLERSSPVQKTQEGSMEQKSQAQKTQEGGIAPKIQDPKVKEACLEPKSPVQKNQKTQEGSLKPKSPVQKNLKTQEGSLKPKSPVQNTYEGSMDSKSQVQKLEVDVFCELMREKALPEGYQEEPEKMEEAMRFFVNYQETYLAYEDKNHSDLTLLQLFCHSATLLLTQTSPHKLRGEWVERHQVFAAMSPYLTLFQGEQPSLLELAHSAIQDYRTGSLYAPVRHPVSYMKTCIYSALKTPNFLYAAL